jgi:hypothetical protein
MTSEERLALRAYLNDMALILENKVDIFIDDVLAGFDEGTPAAQSIGVFKMVLAAKIGELICILLAGNSSKKEELLMNTFHIIEASVEQSQDKYKEIIDSLKTKEGASDERD